MQPLYRNNTVMDKSSCSAFLALSWGKNATWFRVLLNCVAIFSAGYGTLQAAAIGIASLGYTIVFWIMAGAAFFLANWGWMLRVQQYYNKQKDLWGAETLEKKVLFYPDTILQVSSMGELRFPYTKITGIKQNKKAVLILMGKNAMLLNKNGFENARVDDFVAFIKEKLNHNKLHNKHH